MQKGFTHSVIHARHFTNLEVTRSVNRINTCKKCVSGLKSYLQVVAFLFKSCWIWQNVWLDSIIVCLHKSVCYFPAFSLNPNIYYQETFSKVKYCVVSANETQNSGFFAFVYYVAAEHYRQLGLHALSGDLTLVQHSKIIQRLQEGLHAWANSRRWINKAFILFKKKSTIRQSYFSDSNTFNFANPASK